MKTTNAPDRSPGRPGNSPSHRTVPLRHYQRDALTACDDAERRGVRRQLVVLPTGAGKTITFAHGIAQRGGRALVLAHRDELITQAADKIGQVAPGLGIGVVKAEADDYDAQVVVASVQTLCRPERLDRIGRDFTTIVVDEAHHAAASTYRAVLDSLGSFRADGPLTLGFTATAGRSDGVGLGHVWEQITYQRGILQMIAEGYLCDVSALAITSDVDFGNVGTRGGDFMDSDLGAEMERSGAIEAAAVAYAQYAADRRGIAFTATVDNAKKLAARLRAHGITAESVDGTMSRTDRRDILDRLHSGVTQVVTNCAVLTEGFDEPAVSTILMCRPTKSAALFTQMVGRALRPYPGKENALVLDVAGASSVGLATIADLAGLPPGEVGDGETLTEAYERIERAKRGPALRSISARQVDLFKRSALRWLIIDTAFILPAGKSSTIYLIPAGGNLWDVYRHPRNGSAVREHTQLSFDLAMGVGEEIARANGGTLSLSDARWRERAPSDAQKGALVRMGYGDKIGQIPTSGQASDLMARHIAAGTVRTLLRGAR